MQLRINSLPIANLATASSRPDCEEVLGSPAWVEDVGDAWAAGWSVGAPLTDSSSESIRSCLTMDAEKRLKVLPPGVASSLIAKTWQPAKMTFTCSSFFCNTNFPLASSRWVGWTLSSLCPLFWAVPSINLSNMKRKILGNAKNQTQGLLVPQRCVDRPRVLALLWAFGSLRYFEA